MTVFIVIFITLSLMGSALWVLPSKGERQKMSLRMQARQHGLSVQLTSIELPDKWDKTTNKQNVCAYSIFRHKAIEFDAREVLILPFEVWKYHELLDGCWVSHGLSLDEKQKKLLKQCVGLFCAIKVTAKTVDFYWHEKGQEADVKKLYDLLSMLEKLPVDQLTENNM
ncbi:hypothetical protein [Marinomonas epiphytica]